MFRNRLLAQIILKNQFKTLDFTNKYIYSNKSQNSKIFFKPQRYYSMNNDNQDPPKQQEEPRPEEQEGEKVSKKALKKAEKDAKKATFKAEKATIQSQQQNKEEDAAIKANYGDYELIQSQEKTDRKWTEVGSVYEELVGQIILVRARLHSSRGKGNLVFVILRDKCYDIQAVASPKEGEISKQMIKWISSIPKESIVDVYAEVIKPAQEILSCSQKVELRIQKFFIISRSVINLPFQLEDASRRIAKDEIEMENYDVIPEQPKEESKEQGPPIVSLKTRLDNRTLDLRTKANQAIFRVSSAVGQLFREFLYKNGFIEIHTPKLISGASEGGANVFKLNYFNQPACLAQSPQHYKQMCVMADFDRVFEIGPVFRAENSFTPRHMCEFTGLDMEMTIKENYHEILDLLGELFAYIFEGLETRFSKELAAINEQFPYEPFRFKRPVLKLTFEEGIALLKSKGIEQEPLEDLLTVNEKALGAIVKEKYDTDFYMLHRYPTNARPFYTMLTKEDKNYTNSYDFFMGGEEITSGAQRIHDPELLTERAKVHNIPIESIKDYIDSFRYGAAPDGGCGIGLERVVMFYCALGNIRKSSLFPRDPKRIAP